jgi:hypothetical protein
MEPQAKSGARLSKENVRPIAFLSEQTHPARVNNANVRSIHQI